MRAVWHYNKAVAPITTRAPCRYAARPCPMPRYWPGQTTTASRTGRSPHAGSGPVHANPNDSWRNIAQALRRGFHFAEQGDP
jgi:hypothetical protein